MNVHSQHFLFKVRVCSHKGMDARLHAHTGAMEYAEFQKPSIAIHTYLPRMYVFFESIYVMRTLLGVSFVITPVDRTADYETHCGNARAQQLRQGYVK
jgi:hypothetical protein